MSALPASILITTYPGQTSLYTNGSGAQFISGATAFLVDALDADQNPIVGPGAPTFTIAATNGTIAAQPTNAQPNKVTITPSAAGTLTVNATASLPSGSGATCGSGGVVCTASASFNAFTVPLVAIGFETSNTVQLVEDNGDGFGSVIATVPTAQPPYFIALCPNGQLLAAGTGELTVSSPPYTSTATMTFPSSGGLGGSGDIAGVACDAKSTVYVADASTIYTYAGPLVPASNPTATTISLGSGIDAIPYGGGFDTNGFVNGALAVAPNSTIFVTTFNTSTAHQAVLSLATHAAVFVPGGTYYSSTALSVDAASDLFITDGEDGEVAEVQPPASNASPIVEANLGSPFDPAGGLAINGEFYLANSTGVLYQWTTPLASDTLAGGAVPNYPEGQTAQAGGPMAADIYGDLFVPYYVGPGSYIDGTYQVYPVRPSPFAFDNSYYPIGGSTNVITSVATFP
ncbi:MAG TPA: hypothetical protein VMD91_09700 [Candidatus Sulfotelmatobacter sp.]|nr:hypothetical protein [Candidatus Sulfotelmatobacter sp.]